MNKGNGFKEFINTEFQKFVLEMDFKQAAKKVYTKLPAIETKIGHSNLAACRAERS